MEMGFVEQKSNGCIIEDKDIKLMNCLGELISSQLHDGKHVIIPEDVDVNDIINIAVQGQMKHLLLGALIKCDISDEVKNSIRGKIVESTLNTFLQVCAAKEIEERLEKNGVKFQLLKGAVMKNVYPAPEMREMSDIDILVFEDSLEACEEVLTGMGFEKEEEIKHHAIFRKKPNVIVEMHWDLYDKNVDKKQYLYFKDNKKSKVKSGKKYTYEFSKEDFYVYMIAHMAKHFYENGCGIRNLVDIYVYRDKYKGEIDDKLISEKLKQCGIYDFERHMCSLAQKWIDGKETDNFDVNLFMYMIDCGIYGKSENGVWGQYTKVNSEAEDSTLSLKRKYYFPKMSYMQEFYPWLKKRPYLIVWAWMLRAGKGIFNGGVSRRNMLVKSDGEKRKNVQEIYRKLNLRFEK